MKWLPRILEGPSSTYVMAVLVAIGHTILAVQAIQGVRFSLYLLIVLFYVWTVLALLNGAGRRRTLESWEQSLEGWDETKKLTSNFANLLVEACSALSTWDRERAEEIMERARTISALREQNFNERMGND